MRKAQQVDTEYGGVPEGIVGPVAAKLASYPRLKDVCFVPGLNAHLMFTISWLNWLEQDSSMSRNWRGKRAVDLGSLCVAEISSSAAQRTGY